MAIMMMMNKCGVYGLLTNPNKKANRYRIYGLLAILVGLASYTTWNMIKNSAGDNNASINKMSNPISEAKNNLKKE